MNAAYTRNQAPGAIPNGAVVEKVNTKQGDTHPDGARATVVVSFGPVDELPGRYFYFVEWEDLPGLPVGIGGDRIGIPERQNGKES